LLYGELKKYIGIKKYEIRKGVPADFADKRWKKSEEICVICGKRICNWE
jgi:hypothetical protein